MKEERLAQDPHRQALDWQIGIWDGMSDVYTREIDKRFVPVIDHVITRASLKQGHRVLDLGTGTGSAALRAAALVAPVGQVTGIDISSRMLA